MARDKKFSRSGTEGLGTRHPMEGVGKQPHHFVADRDEQTKKMSDAEAATLAKQMAKVQAEPDAVYSPTKSSNPTDPRTATASYYSQTQVVVMQWGDGGTAYAYYDVTPQEWDALTKVDSPGKFINSTLNNHNYGPIRGN